MLKTPILDSFGLDLRLAITQEVCFATVRLVLTASGNKIGPQILFLLFHSQSTPVFVISSRILPKLTPCSITYVLAKRSIIA